MRSPVLMKLSTGMPGVVFRPHSFEPTFHKHAKVLCGGCQIHVTNRQTFRAVETGVALAIAFPDLGPAAFKWREPPHEYQYTIPPIDILYGSDRLRKGMATGHSARELAEEWTAPVGEFEKIRSEYLLY